MQTISVSELKTHLSAELKKIERGERITVLDHKRPVAVLVPVAEECLFVREAAATYGCPDLAPLFGARPRGFVPGRGDPGLLSRCRYEPLREGVGIPDTAGGVAMC